MILITVLTAAVMIFPVLMVFAAISDLLTMTISNRVSLTLLLAYPPLALACGVPPATIGLHLACGGAILAVTFAMFAFGWIGGGDAKLAAATAVWIGWADLSNYGLVAAMIGGALTLAILQFRQWPLPRWGLTFDWVTRLHDRKAGVPYGVALAAAGLIVFPDTSLWLAAFS